MVKSFFIWVIFLTLAVMGVFILTGCYKEVKVPVKCDVPKRERPAMETPLSKYLTKILIYTEGLERDLAFCRGENK